jgi:predicted outer membrane repeat protein
VSNNTFSNNTAGMKGGAIFYDQKRPYLSSNNFTNNNAIYGPDYASYPWKLKVQSDISWISSLKGGDMIPQSILIGVFDQDD